MQLLVNLMPKFKIIKEVQDYQPCTQKYFKILRRKVVMHRTNCFSSCFVGCLFDSTAATFPCTVSAAPWLFAYQPLKCLFLFQNVKNLLIQQIFK